MSPVDAAIEILKGQSPGRGVHVRQIADSAAPIRDAQGLVLKWYGTATDIDTLRAAEEARRPARRPAERTRAAPARPGAWRLLRRPANSTTGFGC